VFDTVPQGVVLIGEGGEGVSMIGPPTRTDHFGFHERDAVARTGRIVLAEVRSTGIEHKVNERPVANVARVGAGVLEFHREGEVFANEHLCRHIERDLRHWARLGERRPRTRGQK
jgi:hypothetical protein